MRVSPLPRGDGFEFVDAIVGGSIPKQYVAAVRHGVEEAMATGGATGIPIVDVKVECLDGKTHSVDSSDMAFKTAASTGFQEAIEQGAPLMLEPISVLTVRVPVDVQGDVLGDISARRGRIVSSVTDGDGEQVITAEVPDAGDRSLRDGPAGDDRRPRSLQRAPDRSRRTARPPHQERVGRVRP